jgi:esterase
MQSGLYSNIKGQGEVIILLHGLLGSSENLGRVSTELSKSFEVHSLDLRNHGKSKHSDEMTYRLMSEDVIQYMNERDIDIASVLGHSMGGKVAMTLALNHSSRIDKLIIADISPVTYTAHHELIFKGLFELDSASLKTRAEADKLLSSFVGENGIRQFLLKNLTPSEDGYLKLKINLESIYRNYQNILDGIFENTSYKGPVMFVAGGSSDYIKTDHKDHTMALFPNAMMKIIPDASHWLHADKPRIFIGICERFLSN